MTEESIQQYIEKHGKMVITPVGTSMWPMLRNGKDTVYIVKPCGRLKKYDLPVYRRTDGKLVMHRVMEVHEDSYTMCGDHQTVFEPGITDGQIIAVVKGFFRKEKYVPADDRRYVRYYTFWCGSIRRRKVILYILDLWKRIISKICRTVKRTEPEAKTEKIV